MYKCKNKQKSPHVFPWRERSYPGNVQKSSRELVKARWSQWLNVVVPSPSGVQLFVTPWTAALQASLSLTVSQSLLKLRSIELVMPSNHLILCHPFLLLPSLSPPAFNLSQHQGLFQWVSSQIRWPKSWEFQLQHQSFQWILSDWTEEREALCYRGEWLSWRQRAGCHLASKLSFGLWVGAEWDSEVRKPNSEGSE